MNFAPFFGPDQDGHEPDPDERGATKSAWPGWKFVIVCAVLFVLVAVFGLYWRLK